MNEKYEVVGFERVDYTSKKSGLPVRGYRLYFEFDGKNISGKGTQSEYVSDNDLGSYLPNVGDCVRLYYNRYGRCCGIDVIG